MFSAEILTFSFIAIIIFLTILEFSFLYPRGKSIKSTIVSVGVLGTFTGIVIGLYSFDYKHIEESLPSLLAGLQTAFITSIAGMSASIVLTIIEKFRKAPVTKEKSSSKEVLEDILEELQKRDERLDSLEKLVYLEKLETVENINKEILSKLDGLEKLDSSLVTIQEKQTEQIKSLDDGFEKLDKLDGLEKIENSLWTIQAKQTEQIKSLTDGFEKLNKLDSLDKIDSSLHTMQEKQVQQNEIMIESFGSNFEKMNDILNKTFEKISEGASKEIINALQNVIQDFNNNLTEQFGENFKALNHSVIKMVEWQENYKESIGTMEQGLQTTINSLSQTEDSLTNISARNSEIVDVYDKLQETIKTYETQTATINQHLQTYADLSDKAQNMFPSLENSIKEVTEVFTKEQNIVSDSLKSQSEEIVQVLEKQSEVIIKISEKLPKELATFETSLEALTKSFLDNYTTFLKNAKSLIDER